MYIYIYIYICVYVYICIYIYTYVLTFSAHFENCSKYQRLCICSNSQQVIALLDVLYKDYTANYGEIYPEIRFVCTYIYIYIVYVYYISIYTNAYVYI